MNPNFHSALQGVLQKDEAARKSHHNKLHRHKHQNSEGSIGAGEDSDSDAGASSSSKPKRFGSLNRVLSSYRKRKPSDVGETGSVNSQGSPQKERSGSGNASIGDVVMSPVAEDHKEKEDGALDLGSPPSSPMAERTEHPSIIMTPPAVIPGIEESGILVHHPSDGDMSAGTKMTPAAANSTTFGVASTTSAAGAEAEWENVQEGEGKPLKGQGSLTATDDGTLADESDMSFMNQPRTAASIIKAEDGASMDVHPGDTDPSQRVPATPAIKADFTPPITPVSTKAKLVAIDEKVSEEEAETGPLGGKSSGVETAAQYAVSFVVLALSLASLIGFVPCVLFAASAPHAAYDFSSPFHAFAFPSAPSFPVPQTLLARLVAEPLVPLTCSASLLILPDWRAQFFLACVWVIARYI